MDDQQSRRAKSARDDALREVPNTIPLVGFDENDEPFIVRPSLIKPSPLPYWVAALVVVMMCLSFGYIIWDRSQRNLDIDCELDRDRALAVQITQHQDIQDADRQRLTDVITVILTAESREESRLALETYVADQEKFTELQDRSRQDIRETLERNCGRG